MNIDSNFPDELLRLSSLSDDEYSKMLDKYNSEKMASLEVEIQKQIKAVFDEETKRRKASLSELSNEIDKIERKKTGLEKTLSKVQSVFGSDLSYLPGLANDVKNLESELKNCYDKLDELYSNYDAKQSIIDNSKKVSRSRFSVTKKRAMDGKKVVVTNMKGTKQKICSVGKSLLDRIKKKANSIYSGIETAFAASEAKKQDTLDEINRKMVELFDEKIDNSALPIDAYSEEMKKIGKATLLTAKYKFFQRTLKRETFMHNGILRTIKAPKEWLKKLRERSKQRDTDFTPEPEPVVTSLSI